MVSTLDEFIPRLKLETLRPYKPYNGTVYHYTSLRNINSILTDENALCLWASRQDCLNDMSEGTLPAARFEQACESLKESGAISEGFYNLIHDVPPNRTDLIIPAINGKTRPFRGEYDTYITSFSEDPDALAMWNYYSKGNRYEGMNIGVSSQALLDSLDSNLNRDHAIKLKMVKVVYDENEQLEILQAAILDLFHNYTPEYDSSVRYRIGTLLTTLKPLFKLDYFSHEKEVRLFVRVFKKYKNAVDVYYRSNAGFVIPYIKLNIAKSSVSQITLGPSLGNEEQKERQQTIVQELLESRGYQAAVKCSEIPVRY